MAFRSDEEAFSVYQGQNHLSDLVTFSLWLLLSVYLGRDGLGELASDGGALSPDTQAALTLMLR